MNLDIKYLLSDAIEVPKVFRVLNRRREFPGELQHPVPHGLPTHFAAQGGKSSALCRVLLWIDLAMLARGLLCNTP